MFLACDSQMDQEGPRPLFFDSQVVSQKIRAGGPLCPMHLSSDSQECRFRCACFPGGNVLHYPIWILEGHGIGRVPPDNAHSNRFVFLSISPIMMGTESPPNGLSQGCILACKTNHFVLILWIWPDFKNTQQSIWQTSIKFSNPGNLVWSNSLTPCYHPKLDTSSLVMASSWPPQRMLQPTWDDY